MSGSDFAALNEVAGPWTIRRSYEREARGIPASWSASAAGIDVGRRASVWSGKPNLAQMAAGALDADVGAFIGSIPDTHLAFVTIWHEADSKIRNHQIALADYVAAFRRFADLVHQAGKPRVYVAQILTVWSGIAAPAGTTYADTWPGEGYVDVLALDGYSDVGSGSSLWGPAISFATNKNIPWAIAEAGCAHAASASWMADQAEFAAAIAAGGARPRCAFLCWFSGNEGRVIPTPGNDPALQATSRQIAQTYHADVNTYLL